MNKDYSLFQTGKIHDIPVCVSHLEKALTEVEVLMREKPHNYVCFCEGNLFFRACVDPEVKQVIRDAALIYPDGIAVAKDFSFATGRNVKRVSGPSFILKACEYGVPRNWRHFFLGGGEGIAEKLADELSKKYPGLCVAGWYTLPFTALTEEEELQIKRRIEESHTDLLWVGLGGPKQEFWMRNHLQKIDVPVMIGIGAAFDFHTNNRPWAPKWIREIGMEWLWRMFFGGRKTFFRNLKCVPCVFFILLYDFLRYKLHLAKKEEIVGGA